MMKLIFFVNLKPDKTNLNKNIIRRKSKMLSENLEVTINFYNENRNVTLPNQITCEIDKQTLP